METHVVAAIIRKGGLFLIAQRMDSATREAGKWEFPGGKVEQGEEPRDALAREIMEELGIVISVGPEFAESGAEGKGMRIRLVAYLADWVSGEPKAIEVKGFRYVAREELPGFEWAEADKPIVRKLLAQGPEKP